MIGQESTLSISGNQDTLGNVDDKMATPLETRSDGDGISRGGSIALITCIVASLAGLALVMTYRKLSSGQSSMSTSLPPSGASLSSGVV